MIARLISRHIAGGMYTDVIRRGVIEKKLDKSRTRQSKMIDWIRHYQVEVG